MKDKGTKRTNSLEKTLNNNMNKTNTSIKRSDTISKRIDNISYQINIEKRNKNELQKKFDFQIRRIEVAKERLELDLTNTITELNKMEVKVFEIQKTTLERFKNEIMKYENIYNEIKSKSENIVEQLSQSITIDNLLYNQTFMLQEDYLSYSNELVLLRIKREDKIKQLKEIEKEHPKEYKFMQEEFQLENSLIKIKAKAKINNELIKKNMKEKESCSRQREMLLKQLTTVEVDGEEVYKETESAKKDDLTISALEGQIKKTVSNIVLWEKMKEMMRLLFSDQNNDNDEKDKLILKLEKFMLTIKMDLMQLKKAKLNDKTALESRLDEVTNKTAVNQQYTKDDIPAIELKLTQTKQELLALESNLSIFESLFNKYIVLFKNESKNQNDIETRFKTEMITILIAKPEVKTVSMESIKSFSQLICSYFDGQLKRDIKQKDIQYAQKKIEDRISIINHDMDKLNETIKTNEMEISSLQMENNQIAKDIITLTETISIKNKNLKTNLEFLGEDQFKLYLESNETVLKNMKKIYGTKILNKVFKVQKDKFLETVIIDHSFKKSIVNESISFIFQYEDIKLHYKKEMDALDMNYQTLLQKYESCLNFQIKKKKEKDILEESSKDLKEKMEMILDDQLKTIQIEKQNLHLQFNINFYLEKVKEITDRIESLTQAKKSIMEEFEAFQKDYNEKEHQLFFENVELKQTVGTLNGVCGPRDDSMLISLLPLNSNNSKMIEERKNNIFNNADDSVRRSILEFHKSVDTSKLAYANNENNNFDLLNSDNHMMNTNTKSFYTQGNYQQYSKNPTFDILSDKLKPLLNGLNLYKKFDNKTMSSKTIAFDPFKADKCPPESCGYALRFFKINVDSKAIIIKKQITSYHPEMKLPLISIVGIFLGHSSKEIIKIKEYNSSNPNNQIELICKHDFIPFTLVLDNDKLELIAPDYLTYTSFECSIRDIILNKAAIRD